jgi:predicted RNA-binding Zn ribbon-like protein
MDEADKRKIGEQIEPGGRPKAPGRLALLQRFINTWNHDLPAEWDRIGDGEKAAAWLAEKGLAGDPVSDEEAAQLRELREAVRKLVIGDPEPLRALRLRLPLIVAVDSSGRTALEPAVGGIEGAAATLLGILHEAQLGDEWSRMKACRQCEYAFYDRSKNRSAAWCAMSICGNRTKNRTYYRRRREGA